MAEITAQDYWVRQAQLVSRPQGPLGERLSDRHILQQQELIKIEISAAGTTVKWVMFAANWASLYFAMSWIETCPTTITLNFFNSGWFEESFDTAHDAQSRIDALIPKSDVRFSTRTFTRPFDPDSIKLPTMLRQAWKSGSIDESHAVYCAIDTRRKITQVEHVGADSALAKVWGISPVSYPCLSGHSYDRIVSQSYFEVVKTGRPVYDHILAAMVHPGGEVRWFGYHRLVFPSKVKTRNFDMVTVACEVAKVDIPIL